MAGYKLSRLAARHYEDIFIYTLKNWGEDQALLYMSGLDDFFLMLNQFPDSGRDMSHIIQGVRRAVYRQHSVYYVDQHGSFLVLAVFGRQDPQIVIDALLSAASEERLS